MPAIAAGGIRVWTISGLALWSSTSCLSCARRATVWRFSFVLLSCCVPGLPGALRAQTNPAAQPLPYAQDFGTGTFSNIPAGVAAWSGINGGSVNTATLAASSAPSSDAALTGASTTQLTGGSYGYATSDNGRFYIQTSSNATNGANQLAIAVNTSGWVTPTLSYDIEIISAQPRTVRTVCQYRVGASGSWTTGFPRATRASYSRWMPTAARSGFCVWSSP